ncbi:hypothetical protein XM38_026700 [Halomicronema hongdechloris C2206]|uniref:SpoVT-AbrB domain-containing protein n=1 Tax=Halomicronema hongdechloris C2206 TaxID=1641165 RepID=A0A1Z3HN75_9CYAN|nr:hypothetical protein [Halomicronema hongdechloris]ASC71716.1 hypothetical protein XM38_026700 [Halomicronema hongdechloris C2206]
MRKATIVRATRDRQLEISPEIQAQLNRGDEYLIWQSGDSIHLQKIHKPSSFEDLMARVDALGPDPDQLNMEEITNLVKEVRRDMQQSNHQE